MGGQVFKKDAAGIRELLKSPGCLQVVSKYATKYKNGEEVIPFTGFDRAKCFVKQKRSNKWSKQR